MQFLCSFRRGLTLAAIVVALGTTANAQQYQILRAEYGQGNQWADVTMRVRDLVRYERAFRVTNETLGIDPAVGWGKSLRIETRGRFGDIRTFEFVEGNVVDSAPFLGEPNNFDPGPGGD